MASGANPPGAVSVPEGRTDRRRAGRSGEDGRLAGTSGRPTAEYDAPPRDLGPSLLTLDGPRGTAAPQGDRYLEDLHLDEIIGRLTAGREAFDLGPFYREPLFDVETVVHRQDVFRDLEREATLTAIKAFAASMAQVRERERRAERSDYRYERERWHLDASAAYVAAVDDLAEALRTPDVRSRGLAGYADYLATYLKADAFRGLAADIERLDDQLASVHYTLGIVGGRVVVARYAGEPDDGRQVVATFARFSQGEGREFRFSVRATADMNHIEAALLDRVALLFPDVFATLDRFQADHEAFVDPVVARLDREAQFFLAYVGHMAPLRKRGLRFCYPEVSLDTTVEEVRETFDLALAAGLERDGKAAVVVNDAELRAGERLIVVSGPNQGGKTTFGRTFGQLHHLARIGLPVPGSTARLRLARSIFTHFERQERVEDLAGKLEEDLRRIRAILDLVTADSVVVMNESFSSTTLDDQLFINTRVVRALLERGCLGLIVTFLDELATLDPSIVSMVSTVDPAEPAKRTFRIVRRPADGLAYAMSIAEKHGLTHDRVAERIRR